MSILIVDDEIYILEELKEALTFEGYAVVTATSVREACKILSGANDITLVITDLKMPGESGKDLIRHITKGYPGAYKFIVISGHGVSLSDNIAEVNEIPFILKPVILDEVIKTVKTML